MLCESEGGDENDHERVHPPGATAVVDKVETLPAPQGWAVHVVIGEGPPAIMNVLDESDFGGLYPFEHDTVANCNRYADALDELELPPNGDDFNTLLDLANGHPYRAPHVEGR